MRILFDIGHPAQVHFFKYAIKELKNNGHEVFITAKPKEMALELLEHSGLDYFVLTKKRSGLGKAREIMATLKALNKYSKKIEPDLLIGGSGNFYVAQVSKMLNKQSIVFEDGEDEPGIKLYSKFADVVCTPDTFTRGLKVKRWKKYKSYKELAYLHPNRFEPDDAVKNELGDNYAILRFVGWKAVHDIGQKGFQKGEIKKLIDRLSPHCKVYMSSEIDDPELSQYQFPLSPEKMHDALAYANLFVGDSQAMSMEAAVLGTPSVRYNTFDRRVGYCNHIEDHYGLLNSFSSPEKAIDKAIELIKNKNAQEHWNQLRNIMLNDRIDVTEFIVNTIEEILNESV